MLSESQTGRNDRERPQRANWNCSVNSPAGIGYTCLEQSSSVQFSLCDVNEALNPLCK